MLSIKDTIKLSYVKFISRKWRNMISGFTISFSVIALIIFFIVNSALTGIFQKAYPDSLLNENLLILSVVPKFDQTPNFEEKPDFKSYSQNDIKARFKDAQGIKEVYKLYEIVTYSLDQEIELNEIDKINFNFESYDPMMDDEINNISLINEYFVKDYIYEGQRFDSKKDGAIPVIVNKSILNPGQSVSQNNSEETYKKNQDFYRSKIGKKFELVVKDKKVTLFIAGFNGGDLISGNLLQPSQFILPDWVLNDNESKFLSDLEQESTKSSGQNTFVLGFDSKENKDKFAKANSVENQPLGSLKFGKSFDNDSIYLVGEYPSALKMFKTFIDSAIILVLCVSLFFIVIAIFMILTTVLKITSDSSKEIGVFRAIGAQKSDISKIFFGYTFILMSSGIGFAIILSYLFILIISLIWGNEIFYSIVMLSNQYDIDKPFIVLFSIPVLEVMVTALIVYLVGFISAFIPIILASRKDPIVALRSE